MAVYKRNKTWYVYFYTKEKGKLKKKGVSVGTRKDEAEALDRRIKQWLSNDIDPMMMLQSQPDSVPYPTDSVDQNITLQEFVPMFMKLHASNQSEKMQVSYRTSLGHILPVFGESCLAGVTKARVQAYMTNRIQDGVSNATVNRELACLKVIFQRAVDWDILPRNPLHGIKALREAPIRERYLTQDEYGRLLDAAPDHLRDIIVFALGTGCRKTEIFNLTWDDVILKSQFSNGTVTIVGKGGKRRTLHLNRAVYELLKRLYEQRTSEYVFPSPRTGGKLDTVKTSFKNALKKAGISNFRFHDLRHTAASWMIQNGADIYAVKNILGHASVNTTERYAHQSPEYLGNQIRKLDDFLIDETTAADGETSEFQAVG